MAEIGEIEIGIELAIDAGQEIQVESGSHASGAVIGLQPVRHRLFQVRSEQERVARLQDTTHLCQKSFCGGAIKVADGAAEKQNEQMFLLTTPGSHFQEAVEISALQANC